MTSQEVCTSSGGNLAMTSLSDDIPRMGTWVYLAESSSRYTLATFKDV